MCFGAIVKCSLGQSALSAWRHLRRAYPSDPTAWSVMMTQALQTYRLSLHPQRHLPKAQLSLVEGRFRDGRKVNG